MKKKILNHDQLNGCACVVCGRNDRALIPIGLETSISTEVFRCETCEADRLEVAAWIQASDSPTPPNNKSFHQSQARLMKSISTAKAKKPAKKEAKTPKGGTPHLAKKTAKKKAAKKKLSPMTPPSDTPPAPAIPVHDKNTILHINPLETFLAPELAIVPTMLDVAGHFLSGKSASDKKTGAELDLETHALLGSFAQFGVKEPIKGTLQSDGQLKVWDGRHRREWSLQTQQPTIPVILVTEEEGRALMELTVMGRRHWLKGQRAYLTVRLHPEVCGNTRATRKASDPIGSIVTTTDLATRAGVSADTIGQAVDLYRKFYAPGFAAGTPEAIEAAADREKFEMLIWSGNGLGAIIAGIAAYKKTGGNPRAKSGFHNLDKPFAALANQAKAFVKWDSEERTKASTLMVDRMKALPAEFRLALSEAIAAAEIG